MPEDVRLQLQRALALQPPGPLAVGLSGGLDSTVLLHALAALPEARERGLRALHVDHRLHPDSAAWARRCEAQCRALDIACTVQAVQVEAAGRGVEAAAREARYRAFERQLGAGETLLLAHHRDDQVETVLLRLLRGAGSGALAGMPAARPLGHARIWRPLLEVGREALQAYATHHGLQWIDDPANRDPRHDRNFVRHTLLPLLQQRWPQAAPAIATSAGLLADDAALVDRLADNALADAQGLDPHTLSLPALRALDVPLARHVLRRWLRGLDLPLPPATILHRVPGELIDVAGDREPRLRFAGVELRRYRDLLHARPVQPPPPTGWTRGWDGRAPLLLPVPFGCLHLLPAGNTLPPMQIAPRRGGERIRLAGRPGRPLKHALQELGVPPWERERLPLLHADDGELLAAGDLVVSARLQALLDERDLSLRWEPGAID